MIIEETINNLIFQEQRTYRVYLSEDDLQKGKISFATSDVKKFENFKEKERKKESKFKNFDY